MVKEKRLITVALPYTNNVPHIGNIVGSHLPGDIFARYCRLQGHDIILIGGTDEHGTPITVEAQKLGITPKELCDKFYKIHKDIYDWFNISYDNFSRTSRQIHHETAQEFFLNMYKNDFLSEEIVKIPFCENCKKSLPDRYIQGICPNCGYESARGDQCESCSSLLDSAELKSPYCVICNSKNIKFLEKKHLFFRLDKLSKKLEVWIKENKTWRKTVKAIALGWIKEGLKPRDITRDMDWGVKIPIKGYENSVIYVWGEAAIGYVSSTKEWNKNKWQDYWKNKKCKIYHFIGKDNIPFHTLLFPAELMAQKDFNLPYNVVGLQYLNYERGKFSKSKGHGVFCENLPTAGLAPDYWRFYLSFVIPETKDTEFLWQDFQERINSDLIGNFSNFVNRTLRFAYQNFDGKIPSATIKDKKIQKKIIKLTEEILNLFEKVELRQALEKILILSDLGNKYFQEREPWKTKDKETIFICANLCKILALLIQPYMPSTSQKILNILNCKEKDFKNIRNFNLKDHKINEPEILFNKLDNEKIGELKQKTSNVTQFLNNNQSNQQKMTSFTDLDLRVGKIKAVKDHPNADKLYILLVDLGKYNLDKSLQIVSGLKNHYKKEELIEKKIIVIINLEDSVIRGVESSGMLLAVEDNKNNLALLTAKKSILGSKVYTDQPDKKEAEKIEFNQFKSIKMLTKNNKVYYNNKPLKTDKEDIFLDKSMQDNLVVE